VELTASIFRAAEGEEYSSLPALKIEAVSSLKTLVGGISQKTAVFINEPVKT